MDNLEEFIKNNKGQFDDDAPSPDIWNRIQAERKPTLPMVEPQSNQTFRVLKIAASFLILALAAFGSYKLAAPSKITVATIDGAPTHLAEMDAYYQKQVSMSLTKVEAILDDTKIVEEVKNELQLLDIEKAKLLDDYTQNTNKKEVVEALINTYRMKLQVLENIVSLLDNTENEKDQSI